MAYRGCRSGIWVAVLCQFGTLAACSGIVTDENSGDPGAGTGGADSGSTSGDGDAGDGDGDSSRSGGNQTGTGGVGDVPIACPDILYAQATIILVGAPAPAGGGRCLANLDITGHDTPPNFDCLAVEEGCSCALWDGSLTEGMNTIRVLDEEGALVTSYSGPYPTVLPSGPCGGPRYETIEINYVVPSPRQISCERSGIVEFCGLGEGCCNCGCGIATDSCTQEIACPAHQGPTCGLSQCREGTICCDPHAGHCAESAANCPE